MNKMKKAILFCFIFSSVLSVVAQKKIRQYVDTVGFATKAWQMDSVLIRIHKTYDSFLTSANALNSVDDKTAFRLAICPHDDYTYAGFIYESVIPHIKAKTVVIFGVAHKAKKFNIEQQLVFDSYDEWKEPYGNIAVSPLRDEIMKKLPGNCYMVHDSLQQVEHSVEAIIPFLQYHDKNVQIVPILVPYMRFDLMNKYALFLAAAIESVMKEKNLQWGKDIAMVISNDAVHYGDEDWGGKNYATYGCDSAGYEKAVEHESEIIEKCLLPELDTSNIHRFVNYTVSPANFRDYIWPWCGRYSVPFGMLTAMYLNKIVKGDPLVGIKMEYSTSIAQKPLPVDDLKMGKTAIATLHHWVGYAGIGYK